MRFINSKLTPLILIASIALGVGGRGPSPPGGGTADHRPDDRHLRLVSRRFARRKCESRIMRPMERLLWEIPGVEYIYSTASPGSCMTIVRFYVGEDEEKSIVRLNQKMFANFDLIPPGASQPLIKPRSIDDVPFLALTLWSTRTGRLPDPARGGGVAQRGPEDPRHLRHRDHWRPAPAAPGGAGRDPTGGLRDQRRRRCAGVLQAENRETDAGEITRGNEVVSDSPERFSPERRGPPEPRCSECTTARPSTCATSRACWMGRRNRRTTSSSRPGPAARSKGIDSEPGTGRGNARRLPGSALGGAAKPGAGLFPGVTLSVAKRKGKNAVELAAPGRAARGGVSGPATSLPSLQMTVTRNYGETAAEKSNELLLHMMIAVLSVTLLIWLILGFREAGVVAVAIPVTLALTLVVFLLYGYTLNRITLFALIFSIGILVDDAIVVVENIVRHKRLPAESRPQLRRCGGRGGRRGRQPHDSRHLDRHRRDPAHGSRPRADGPVHAPDPDRRLSRDDFLAAGRLRRDALGRRASSAVRRGWPRARGATDDWSHAALPSVHGAAAVQATGTSGCSSGWSPCCCSCR